MPFYSAFFRLKGQTPVEEINFSDFKKWSEQRFQYFRFFDIWPPACSKEDDFLVSIQDTRSFGKMTTMAGLIFLYKHIESKQGDVEINLNHIIQAILPYLYVYYKTNFMVESKLPEFNIDKKQLKDSIILRATSSPVDISDRVFDNMMNTYFGYSQFYFNEKECLRELHKIIDIKRYDFKFEPIWSKGESVSDLIKNGAIALLEMEEKDLENTKQELESLKDFNEDVIIFFSTRANLKLQSKISTLTMWTVILTVIIALLTTILILIAI